MKRFVALPGVAGIDVFTVSYSPSLGIFIYTTIDVFRRPVATRLGPIPPASWFPAGQAVPNTVSVQTSICRTAAPGFASPDRS